MDDKKLEEFRELLLNRKEQILKNIDYNSQELNSLKGSEANDEADHAVISADAAIEEALSRKQFEEIKEIDYALFKINNKTYGICEMCEEPIGEDRLKVKPQAKYCIVCREIAEKRG
jgi:DnaK suppressor protein